MLDDDFYENQYQKLIWHGFIIRLVGIAHGVIEFRYDFSQRHENVLEVGDDHDQRQLFGQRLSFVKSKFTNCLLTDLIPPKKSYAAHSEIVAESKDAQELIHSDCVFDRIIAICLPLYLDFQANLLKVWRRVTKPGGAIPIYLAADPGKKLRFFRLLLVSSKAAINSYRNDLRTIQIEHRNSYLLCKTLTIVIFGPNPVRFRQYTFPFLS